VLTDVKPYKSNQARRVVLPNIAYEHGRFVYDTLANGQPVQYPPAEGRADRPRNVQHDSGKLVLHALQYIEITLGRRIKKTGAIVKLGPDDGTRNLIGCVHSQTRSDMTQRSNMVPTATSNFCYVLVERECRIKRHTEQSDGKRDLKASSVNAGWLVGNVELLLRAEENCIGLWWMD
jgi:hypothetical protein